MYPLRLNQQSHIQNQNVQNQLQQRSESTYGVRGITPGLANRTEGHGTTERQRDNYSTTERRRDNYAAMESSYGTRTTLLILRVVGSLRKMRKSNRARPESMYGMLGAQSRRVQSAQSDDSSYSSYTVNSNSRNAAAGSANNSAYHSSQNPGNYPPKATTRVRHQ
ncbi:hypothetical protein NQ318_016067 [Aromia moschata]|uniref:Uncharacterized protein n=1 Tax=Aromia moschata TaxID=1265417 RepID=A0AAV8XSG7_9CUCU|nr:hypothetical protein NQ318_016067 [Aromia moschata]